MEDGLLSFECPRCGATVAERFWGPCSGCRDTLARTMAGEARDVEVAAFEPAMHVVPNHVATKE